MGRDRYGWTLVVVAISAFMVTLDNTITAATLPTMQTELGTTLTGVNWIPTAYILMFACLMIAGGRLVDVYGARLIYTIGMSVFTLSSLTAGLSQDLTQLIVSRIAQGAGAALALPATLIVVTVGRTDRQRSQGQIIYILIASVATALGPWLGGVITDEFGWHWIFLINILPGLFVIVLGLFVMDGQREDSPEGVDLPAVLTSATCLFAFTYAITVASDRVEHGLNPFDSSVVAILLLSVIAFGSFIVVEKWAPNPMITTEFFRNKTYTGGIAAQVLWGMGFVGVLTFSSRFMQEVLHWQKDQAGAVFIAPAVLIGLMTPVAFAIANRTGPKIPITTGMIFMGLGLVMFSRLKQGDDFYDMIPGILLVGVGSALVMPLGMFLLKVIPESRVGVAGSLLNVAREVSGAFGIVILGSILSNLTSKSIAQGHSKEEALEQGSSAALAGGAVLVLVGAVIVAFTLQRKKSLVELDKTTVTPREPERPAVSSGAFPIIPDWWGANQRAGIPSAWPPPPSHSPYELDSAGSSRS